MSERDLPSRGRPANPEDVTRPDALPDAAPGIEEPEADFIEQRLDEEDTEAEEPAPDEDVLFRANPADIAEQRAAAPADEDEYR